MGGSSTTVAYSIGFCVAASCTMPRNWPVPVGATRAGAALELTATELRLLGYLVGNRGRTVSKTQILTQVWGYEDYDPNLVEVHVSALRRKLEQHGPRLIHTARGLGYVVRP